MKTEINGHTVRKKLSKDRKPKRGEERFEVCVESSKTTHAVGNTLAVKTTEYIPKL